MIDICLCYTEPIREAAIIRKKEYAFLCNTLIPTQTEGFPVTKQTKPGCMRLLNGEISKAALVQEIIDRRHGNILQH